MTGRPISPRLDLIDNVVRDTLGTGIYFMTYESSKQLLTTFGGDGTHSNPLAVLVAGGLCGIVSWAMICEYLWTAHTCTQTAH